MIRALILADDCNPEWPSLPVVGYKAARAIAQHADVMVVTQVRNRENIEKAGFGRATVRYIDSEYIARPVYNLAKLLRGGTQTGWTTAVALAYPSYLAFELEVWKATREQIKAGDFDIVHRITPMSPTLPSPMASWSPIPFVLGPLNGGLPWPSAFSAELKREREWLSYVRDFYRILPYRQSTYRKSTAVLSAFQHTIDDLPRHAEAKIVNFPEIGFDPDLFKDGCDRETSEIKTILFVGRLVPYKLPMSVVQAFADSPTLHAHRLVIVGDGPERPAIEKLIRERGIADRVELTGWKNQTQVAAYMQNADIFAFPSIRELGAGAVLEAMACGLACVVIDYGGPGALIDNDRGMKIPLGTRDQITWNLGRALEKLVMDPQLVTRLGVAAREHALQYYTWDKKALKTLEVYNWALGRRRRPHFWNTPE